MTVRKKQSKKIEGIVGRKIVDLKLAEMYLQLVASSGIAGNLIFSAKAFLYAPHCGESFGKTVTPVLSEKNSNAHPAHRVLHYA